MKSVRLLVLTLALFFAAPHAQAGPPFPEFVDPNPTASNGFGTHVVVLGTGNVAISSPAADIAGRTDCGAVYLFNGATGALISTLRGSANSDQVGSNGIVALTNGHGVVRSPLWAGGTGTQRGAATWLDGTSGLEGQVSASNSLIGSTNSDNVGGSVVALPNGHYVVVSASWDGAAENVGAVTWCNGTMPTAAAVSATNSLIGSTFVDGVGGQGVQVLPSGNYIVRSAFWDGPGGTNAGAVTWCDGATGATVGIVSASNSLIGTPGDQVGQFGVTILTNGNYVVRSSSWAANDFGAATWGSGTAGVSGEISAANSLVGTTVGDQVSSSGITALSNGHYVVASGNWGANDVGAVTWCDGTTGRVGAVATGNSLTGTSTSDQVGSTGVVALVGNGNYVVGSRNWGTSDVGAATWGNGTTGTTGAVSASNSLVGSLVADFVGAEVVPLTNGNYVVRSQSWDRGGIINAGAVTWGNGATGTFGAVSASNSLVGGSTSDQIGTTVTALANGHYVVVSGSWDGGTAVDVGAVTWGNGTTGATVGPVTVANSLTGGSTNDAAGGSGIVALPGGNYVVLSAGWNNVAQDVGAATWGNGLGGTVGLISASNSLVGSTANDLVGSNGVTVLANGHYLVRSSIWKNGTLGSTGAVTWGNKDGGTVGTVNASNSLVGSTTNDFMGSDDILALANGNYVVPTSNWDNGTFANAGAFTFGIGTGGTVGTITAANSVFYAVANGNAGAPVADDGHATFYAPFSGVGKVRLGAQADGFITIAPEIDVQQPTGSSIASGESKGFGDVAVNGTGELIFTIANTGTGPLNLTGTPKVAVSGDAAFSATTQPASPVAATSGITTFTIRFAPTDTGLKTATLTIASNDSNEGTYTITVTGTGTDTTAPETTITSTHPALTNSTAATITFTGSDDVTATGSLTFEGRLDGAPFAVVTSPVSLNGLDQGPHTFEVRARDAAGNTDPTPASATWEVDTSPPSTAITGGPAEGSTTPATSATFTFGSKDPAVTFEGRLDGAPFAPMQSPFTTGPLANGTHTFEVRAVDAAGNVDRRNPTRTWTIGQLSQTISFTLAATAITTDTILLSATGGASGNPVTFSIASGRGSISSGNVLSFTAAGSVTVRASQAGDASYEAAPDVEQTIVVSPAGLAVVADTVYTTSGAVLIDVLANDPTTSGPLTLHSITQPASGGKTKVEAGKIRFTPSGAVTAPITFTYTAISGGITGTTTVTVRPLSTGVGTFVGLLRRASDNSVRGRVVMTVSAKGALTGGLRYEGRTFTLKGGLNGVAVAGTGVIPRPLLLNTTGLDANDRPILSMSIPDLDTPGENFTGTAELSPYSASNPTPDAGTYTMIAELPSGGTGPALGTAMTCKITADGTVKFGGKLGNNVAVTQAGKLLSGGRLPFFVSQGTQRIGGEIVFDRAASPAIDGVLRWSVPTGADPRLSGGLEQDYEVFGLTYTPGLNAAAMFSPTAPSATLTLTVPSVSPTPVVRSLTLTGSAPKGTQKIAAPGVGATVLTFTTANGIFTGTRTIPGNIKRSFFGVIFQGGGVNQGRGVLVEPSTLSPVTIVP